MSQRWDTSSPSGLTSSEGVEVSISVRFNHVWFATAERDWYILVACKASLYPFKEKLSLWQPARLCNSTPQPFTGCCVFSQFCFDSGVENQVWDNQNWDRQDGILGDWAEKRPFQLLFRAENTEALIALFLAWLDDITNVFSGVTLLIWLCEVWLCHTSGCLRSPQEEASAFFFQVAKLGGGGRSSYEQHVIILPFFANFCNIT